MRVENNMLVDDPRIRQPVFSPHYYHDVILVPDFGVVHYTAGDKAEDAINWFANPNSGVSAHFVVWPNGNITQCVPLNRPAHHAGYSEWGGRCDINKYSYGIETTNPGYKREGYPSDYTVYTKHKYENFNRDWIEYTSEEKQTVADLLDFLNGIKPFVDVVGHDEIVMQMINGVLKPGGKTDPGPLLDASIFRERFFGPETENLFIVSRWWSGNEIGAGGVSLKYLPSDYSPSKIWCPAGMIVKKKEWNGRWVKVTLANSKDGWIYERYLRRVESAKYKCHLCGMDAKKYSFSGTAILCDDDNEHMKSVMARYTDDFEVK